MKTHYRVSESPLFSPTNAEVLCGVIVLRPEPVISIEVGQKGLRNFFDPLRDCMKCAEKFYAMPVGDEPIYIYGIVEAMHSGDTLEKIEQAVSKHSKFTHGIDSGPDGKSEIAATENR